MQAVREDKDWNLAFPLLQKEYDPEQHKLDDKSKFVWREWPTTKNYVTREDGLVCCKIYKTLPARRMWDVIMSSTYDFAEPGFILIDRVNEMNNNWWCENIRATNPCVPADTWVQTSEGPRQVGELIGKQFNARVDGVDHASAPGGILPHGGQAAGEPDHHRRLLAAPHRRSSRAPHLDADALAPGHRVVRGRRPQGRRQGAAAGSSQGCGLGGRPTASTRVTSWACWSVTASSPRPAPSCRCGRVRRWATATWARADRTPSWPRRSMPRAAATIVPNSPAGTKSAAAANSVSGSRAISELASELGLRPGRQTVTPAIERGSSEFYRGFLRGLFDAEGSVQGTQAKGVSIRLGRSDTSMLEGVQRMLLRLGIASTIYRNRAQPGLVVTGENVARFAEFDRLLRHREARAPRGPAGKLQAHAEPRALRRHRREHPRRRLRRRLRRADSGHQRVRRQRPACAQLRRAAAAAVWLVPAGLGQSHALREERVHGFRRVRLERIPRSREGVHAHARQRGARSTACRCEQQRNEIMRKRRHGMGFLGLGQHHHLPRHEVRRRGLHQVHRGRFARDGGGRLGSRARSGQGKGPRAHHEGGVHGHRRDAAQASGDGRRTAGRWAT